MEKYVLALDFGTQSIRGSIFDLTGQQLWRKSIKMAPFQRPQVGWAEEDPAIYRAGVVEITRCLKKENNGLFERVAGITLACMRDCVILVDEDGEAIRPMIIWSDERKTETVRPKNKLVQGVISLVGAGGLVRKNSQAGHTNYLRDYEPENWKKAAKLVLLTGYLNRWMLGRFVDCTCNQSGHLPFSCSKNAWSGMIDIKKYVFPIEKEKLVDLVPPGRVMGNLCPKAREALGFEQEVAVIACASDKACETLGSGCVDKNKVVLSFGSQATVENMTDRYYELQSLVPTFPAAMPNHWNSEMQVYCGYWMQSWFVHELEDTAIRNSDFPEQNFDDYLEKTPAGNDGLIMYPFMGACVKYPYSSATFMGLKSYHTKAHLYRAMIEGINYTLRWAVERMEKKEHQSIDEIRVTGGGSHSDRIMQLTADQFGRKVVRIQSKDVTSLGASILGYVSLGVFKDFHEAVTAMVHTTEEFHPRQENTSLYDRIYREYQRDIKKRVHFIVPR